MANNIVLGGICSVLYIIFIICSLPVYVYRLLCILFVKIFRPDIVGILKPLSSMFAVDLTTGKPPRCTIVVNISISPHLPFDTFRNDMVYKNWIIAKDSSGKLKYGKFQQYPFDWLGFTWWKREKFDINNHVFHYKSLENSIVSDTELDSLTEKLLNAPFKQNQSPWEIYLIDNYRSKNSESELMSVMMLKVHHSLADGYSILTALVEGLYEQPVAKLPAPRYPQRSMLQRIRFLVSLPFTTVYELSCLFSNIFDECPWRIPDAKKAWHLLYAKSDLIPTRVVKDIKNATDVSFTSVLISAISASISENMIDRKKKSAPVVKSMSCMSTVSLPGHKRILTNHVTAVMFDVPATSFSAPVDRLQECESVLENAKQSVIPKLTLLYIYGVGCHVTPVVKAIVNTSNITSTGLTNFAGLPNKIFRGEHKLVGVNFAVGCLGGNSGVGFMVLSYDDNIQLSVTAEEAVLSRKEVDAVVTRFTNEIYNLYDIATI